MPDVQIVSLESHRSSYGTSFWNAPEKKSRIRWRVWYHGTPLVSQRVKLRESLKPTMTPKTYKQVKMITGWKTMELINANYFSAVVQSFKILGAKNSGYKNKRKHTHMHRQVYIHLHTHPWPNSFVCGWLTQAAVKISSLDRDRWDKYGDTKISKIKRVNAMKIEMSFQKIRQDHGRNMVPNNEQHWRFKTTKAFVHYLALFTNRVEETL